MTMTDWKEEKTPGEDERFLKGAEFLRSVQKKPDRALHAKAQLGLSATFEVLDGLPDWARVGIAAKPGTYRAYMRYSNGGRERAPDKKGDLRGLAVKIMGVEGKKIIPGMENAKTQDFLFINQPITAVKNADEFIGLMRALQNPVLLLPRLVGVFGFGKTLAFLQRAPKTLGAKVTSVAWTHYYSAAPICWGEAAVKLHLSPKLAEDPNATRSDSPTYLGDEMTARVQKAAVVYDFQIQPYESVSSTPIEDHGVVWSTPFVTVARLTIPQHDPLSAEGRKTGELIEKLSFDPWHALVEHRPLGNMMRARNQAYRLSTQERGAAPEPE
jgi:hypothetical protein